MWGDSLREDGKGLDRAFKEQGGVAVGKGCDACQAAVVNFAFSTRKDKSKRRAGGWFFIRLMDLCDLSAAMSEL